MIDGYMVLTTHDVILSITSIQYHCEMSAVHALKLMGLDAAAEDILSRISGPHPKIKDTLPKKVQVCIK